MNSRMLLVTQSGNVDDLYSLIKAAPDILQNADVLPFVHTPLHEASSTGKIDLAMELMLLKPSFAKKLNEDGFSPLHLAVENKQDTLAIELVKFDPSLVRIRGRGGMTPLHLVAKKGGVDLLIKFLQACPGSINDANLNGETAVHITVMNNKYEELKVLIGWMQKVLRSSAGALSEIQVMNKCDREGNTALHVAAFENNYEAVKQLLKSMSLNRNIQNKSGMTALDVLRANGSQMNMDTEKILQKSGGKTGTSLSKVQTMSAYLRKQVTFREYCSTGMARYRSRMSDGARNSLLVITALIITATYQTAAQPKDKDTLDDMTFEEVLLDLLLLWGFNTIAFCAAIVLTYILLPFGGAYTWWYFVITVPLVISYGISNYMKYPTTFFIFIYLMFVFGFLVYLLIFYIRWKRTTQKKVPKPKRELISQDFKTTV